MLQLANKELMIQNEANEKQAEELVLLNEKLAYEVEEKGKRAAELVIANLELIYENKEKEKRASELIALRTFAYRASHDLQEPLRTISNYMWLFEQDYVDLLDTDARALLSSVTNTTRRMSTLIKSLLNFSKPHHNEELCLVNIKTIINDVLNDLDFLIKDSNSIIEVSEMPSLSVYDTALHQVFQNLITNAIKFKRKDTQPHIRIYSEQINDIWRFSVSDNGIGISQNHFEKVFEIFQRLHTHDEYEGSGIGLANCKKIIQLHDGKIWIESKPGDGTTFHFTIPLLDG